MSVVTCERVEGRERTRGEYTKTHPHSGLATEPIFPMTSDNADN